jgi:hypothetical protein
VECAVVCFYEHFLFLRNDILNRHPLPDLYSSTLRLLCQPVIEFVTADDAQGVPLGHFDLKPLRSEIKVDVLRVHVRDFGHVEPETLEQDLSVEHESAGAKFEAWVTRFFEDQDAGGEMRSGPL